MRHSSGKGYCIIITKGRVIFKFWFSDVMVKSCDKTIDTGTLLVMKCQLLSQVCVISMDDICFYKFALSYLA